MKNKIKIVSGIVGFLMLFCICIYGAYDANYNKLNNIAKSSSVQKKIYLITKGSSSDFWSMVYAGAKAACTEYNMEIFYIAPNNEEDYETQNAMIETAVNNKADAIVFSAIDYEKNREKIEWAAQQGVKIINIDSEVNSDEVFCYIGTDNYKAGTLVGETIKASDQNKVNVGIVNFMQDAENGKSREQGVRDSVINNPNINISTVIHVESSIEKTKEATIAMLKENPEINCVVALNELLSVGVGYAIQELDKGDEVDVIAFDNNVISVSMLEKGDVDALVVQAPYAIGYLGVENAYKALYGEKIADERIDTICQVVVRDDMYSDENQRLLFGFEQH